MARHPAILYTWGESSGQRPPAGGSMMKKFLAPTLVVGLMAGLPGAASSDEFQVGGWMGLSYDDEYSEFSYCAMDAWYESGHDLLFSISTDGVFVIALAHPDWQLEYDATYPVGISIDNTDLGQHWAEVIDDDMIGIEVAYSPQTINLMRKGSGLYINTVQETLFFELSGTDAAIARLEECVAISRPSANPFAEPGTSGNSDNPFSDPGGAEVYAPETMPDEDIQLVLDMLDYAGMYEYWYVYPVDRYSLLFDDADHTWTDGDTTGAMYFFEDDGTMSAIDALVAFFEMTQDMCPGSFSYEFGDEYILPDGVVMQLGLAQCTDDYGTMLIPTMLRDDADAINVISHYADAYFAERVYDADARIVEFIRELYTY
jgi:hypothetical protein